MPKPGGSEARPHQSIGQFLDAIQPSDAVVGIDDREDSNAADREAELHRESRDGRETYAPRLFWLTIIWLGVVLLMLILSAFPIHVGPRDFRLSDSVLITLIGSTTATVLGLFAIVTRFYFHHDTPGAKTD